MITIICLAVVDVKLSVVDKLYSINLILQPLVLLAYAPELCNLFFLVSRQRLQPALHQCLIGLPNA